METILQQMITNDHSGKVHEHIHSVDTAQDLFTERNHIEKDHNQHIKNDLVKIFIRPPPFPTIIPPRSLSEVKIVHGIDTSSWPAKHDDADVDKAYANDMHKKFRPATPLSYDMHYSLGDSLVDSFGEKMVVNPYTKKADVNDPYSEYGDEDHENAYTTVLNNIDTCTQTQGDPLKTGNFCRYDENESVLFRALREVEKLQDLIKDYKNIVVPDNRMMTRLIVHRTGAKVYRTYEGVTWLCKYSRSILFRCNYRYSTTSHTLFPCWYSATQIRGMKTVKSLSIKFTHHQELLSSHIHWVIYPHGIRMASL